MSGLRVIGDVHAQFDFTLDRGAKSYLDLLEGCEYSVQIGDMGDAETYAELTEHVDATHHRFFPGNHDHYDCLPAHSLGDFGTVAHGGIEFFFIRGAASADKERLVRLGKQKGRQLWFEEEELSDQQMENARDAYAQALPQIMMSHTAPTRIGQFVFDDTSRSPGQLRESRTSEFLESILEIHRPRLWLFGHYHHDWRYREDKTDFRCVGELSFLDLDPQGSPLPTGC